jgi:hypothetical protein
MGAIGSNKNSLFDRGSIGAIGLCVKKVIRTYFLTPREPQLISLDIEIWVTNHYPKAKTIPNRD